MRNVVIQYLLMGCCCSLLSSCCCTQAGLRCHSVLSLCGVFYFLFMFLLFDRQKIFYEFHMPEPDNTKTALLITSIIWLVLFAICCFQLQRVKKAGRDQGRRIKSKMSIADIKSLKRDERQEGQPLHQEQGSGQGQEP